MAFVRDVQGSRPGVRLVQIVWSKRQGVRQVEHVGTAHDEIELVALRAKAWERIHAGQQPLDLGLAGEGPQHFPITASRAARLWGALREAYRSLGFPAEVGDSAFEKLVLARIVEPVSKLDSRRVLTELGAAAPSYSTINRCLTRCAERSWREALQRACAAHAGAAHLRLCLYDVTTLYFETDQGDGFREPGYSKERRLEPQITVGLLTTAGGFPLLVRAFEGNCAEVRTIVPVLAEFRAANPEADLTVVADAGMLSEANLRALESAGYSFIVGGRIPSPPAPVAAWRERHPGEEIADGQIFSSGVAPAAGRRQWSEHLQYRASRAARDLRSIEKTVAKAERIIAGRASARRNRFLAMEGGGYRLDDELITSARARAGLRAYRTNLAADPAFVIDAYHQLWQIERSFRMAKSDLRARPAYHHQRERIEAHLTIVFAALAVSRWIEERTGLTIRAFLHLVRPIREVEVAIGGQTITAEDAIDPEALEALQAIHRGH